MTDYFTDKEVTRPIPYYQLTLTEYQQSAMKTAVFPEMYQPLGITYAALKLAGEAGEVAEKIGKMIRDTDFGVKFHDIGPDDELSGFDTDAIVKELGDVLWYCAALAKQIGVTLDEVAAANLEKLASRAERGVLPGSGDVRYWANALTSHASWALHITQSTRRLWQCYSLLQNWIKLTRNSWNLAVVNCILSMICAIMAGRALALAILMMAATSLTGQNEMLAIPSLSPIRHGRGKSCIR